jgi:hypothetical protein
MNISSIKPGMTVTHSDGSLVEVRSVMPDNVHVRVKYLDTMDNPEIRLGEEREVPFEELIGEYMGTHAEGLT